MTSSPLSCQTASEVSEAVLPPEMPVATTMREPPRPGAVNGSLQFVQLPLSIAAMRSVVTGIACAVVCR